MSLRSDIKAKHPTLVFKIKTVSFSDLARESKRFVESSAWGMTKGNHKLYESVKAIAKRHDAIVSW